jgi:hypothetical protein
MKELATAGAPFVAFVGAGASAIPPSCLPTWTQFNDLLLECLCERLAEYSSNRQPTDAMLSLLRARRDKTHFFPPDFQAQLIEEEVGLDYFRVWQSLETDSHGPAHSGLAELASRSQLAAIITTNFDRLIESALRLRGVQFEVFHDTQSFERLAAMAEGVADRIPVIKIHGSIEDPASLVDTLRQRVAGRPEPLLQAIRALLRQHPWLYLGFSGADFSYDPHYLGILDAADDAKGFVFLTREGRSPHEGVRRLAEAYGSGKAQIVQGNLVTWLTETFELHEEAQPPSVGTSVTGQPLQGVRDRIRAWTEELGPIAVVNILQSMLKTSSLERHAHWLLRKTWKSYRTPQDLGNRSYARFNYNYGLSLLEAGYISNPVPLAEDMTNLSEWKEHADQNAYEFLARSYRLTRMPAAGAQLASVLAYRGQVGKALAIAGAVLDEVLTGQDPIGTCDVAVASAAVYDLVQMFRAPIELLRTCLGIATDTGDEPRRAIICACLGRFLTYSGDHEEADRFLSEAETVGRRLDLPDVDLHARAARGLWLADSAVSANEAVRTLQEVIDNLHSQSDIPLFTKIDLAEADGTPRVFKARHPLLCRVLLDLNRAAMIDGHERVMNETLDELDELATQVFVGYCPHYYLSYAQCLLLWGKQDAPAEVRQLIARARVIGEQTENPWVASAADHLEKQVPPRTSPG